MLALSLPPCVLACGNLVVFLFEHNSHGHSHCIRCIPTHFWTFDHHVSASVGIYPAWPPIVFHCLRHILLRLSSFWMWFQFANHMFPFSTRIRPFAVVFSTNTGCQERRLLNGSLIAHRSLHHQMPCCNVWKLSHYRHNFLGVSSTTSIDCIMSLHGILDLDVLPYASISFALIFCGTRLS